MTSTTYKISGTIHEVYTCHPNMLERKQCQAENIQHFTHEEDEMFVSKLISSLHWHKS